MRKVLGLSVAIAMLALFGAQANAYIVDSDVGNAALVGRSVWDINQGIMNVYASGTDIWDNNDGLHFYSEAFDVLDAIDLVARATGFDGGTNDWRKQGLMIRDTLDGNSANAITLMGANPANGVREQWRYTAGAVTDGRATRGNPVPALPPALPGYEPAPQWLRIQRDAVTQADYDAGTPQQIHYYYADGAGLKPGTMTQVPLDIDGIPGQDFTNGPDGLPGTADDVFLFTAGDANPWIELLGTDINNGPDGVRGTADDTWLDVPQLFNLRGDANNKIYAGLAVTSHDNSQITRGQFTDISGIELPNLYRWDGADMAAGDGIAEWRDPVWTTTPLVVPLPYPTMNDDVEIWDQGGPIIRDAESVRALTLMAGAPGSITQLTFEETAGVAGSLTVQGPLNAGPGTIFVRASGASIKASSGAIGGLVLDKGDNSEVKFTLGTSGPMSITNLAGRGRLTVQGGGTLTLTDNISDLANRPIKADGIGFTVDHATLVYKNASNSIVSGTDVLPLGGSFQEIILDSGTLDVTGATVNNASALNHYGWNHDTESEMQLDTGTNLLNMVPDHVGTPLTIGPGGRGFDFTGDGDFSATGAVTQGDHFMNLWTGKLHVDASEVGEAFMLRVGLDDDRAGIWVDLNGNSTIEANERLSYSQWEGTDRAVKTFQFSAAGDYMVAFTHLEVDGGSSAQFRYKAPGMDTEAIIKPADPAQVGRWLGTGPEAVSITNDVTVSGNSKIRLMGAGTPSLAFVGMRDGANLTLESLVRMDVETISAYEGGEVTLTTANDVNMAYYADYGVPATINKAGAATLYLGNITEGLDAGPNSGSDTTLRIKEGTFHPLSQEALGGGPDGFIKLDLAGGTMDIAGADVYTTGTPGLLVSKLSGDFNTTDPNTNNFGTDPLGTSVANTSALPPWADHTTFVMTGEVYIDASGVISFRESIDDNAWLRVAGAQVLNNGGWDQNTAATVHQVEGWYAFELRVGNGTGGAGQVTVPGFGYSRTDTGGDGNGSLYAAALNVNASTASLFRTPTVHAVEAIDWSDIDFSVSADSTLNTSTDYQAHLGDVTLTGGMLTTQGAVQGVTLQSTTVAPAATASGKLGLNTRVVTNPGPLSTNGSVATMSKTGAADLNLTAAKTDAGDMANLTIRVEEGNMNVLNPATVGGATLTLGSTYFGSPTTPKMALSSTEATANYALSVVADGGSDTIDAFVERFFNGGNGTGALNPISNTLARTPNYEGILENPLKYTTVNQSGGMDVVAHTGGLIQQHNLVGLWVGNLAIGGDSPASNYVGFGTNSDDGSIIWVDKNQNGTFEADERIVDNNRDQGETRGFGSVDLAAGNYSIAMGWYDGGGGNFMEAKYTLNSAETLNDDAWNNRMITVNPADTGNGQDKLFVGGLLARNNSTELTIGKADLPGTVTGAATTVRDLTLQSGQLTVNINDGYSLNIPDGIVSNGAGGLVITGGPMTIAATPLLDVSLLRIISGASLSGYHSVTTQTLLELQGAGASLTFAASNVLTSAGADIDVTDGAVLTNYGPLNAANMNLLTGSAYYGDGDSLTLAGGLAVTGGSSMAGYGSVSVDSHLTLEGAAASLTFAAPDTLITSANTTVSVTDGAILTNDTVLATLNFEVLNGSAYVNTGVGPARDINISGNMTVRNSTITNYGSIQVDGNLTLDGSGAQLSFSPAEGTTLATTNSTMISLRNQASLTTATGLHSSGLEILSGANFNRVGSLIVNAQNRDVWVDSILTLDGASLNMVDNGAGMPASTLWLGDNTAVTIGPGQLLKIKDAFDSGSLEIYGTLEMTGADKSISVNNALIMGTGKTLDMSANALNTGPNALVTIGKDSVLIVGGGALLNAGNGFANIRGLDIQGHLERLGDPYGDNNDFSVGVTERLGVGDGQTLDQRNHLLMTGLNTVISVGQGGALYADTAQQGSQLTVTGGIIDVPALTINGQMTFADTTIDAALHGTGGVLLEGMGITGQVNLTNSGNDYAGVTEIRSGVLDVGHVDDTAGNATNEGGLGDGNLSFASRWRDKYFQDSDVAPESPAILQANGLFQRMVGTGVGQVNWNRDQWGGGFAARGDAPLGDPANDLTVTLNSGGGVNMGDYNDYSGFQERWIEMNSPTANGVVTLTNELRVQNDRNVWVWDNPDVDTDRAVFSSRLWDWRLAKYGPGLLELTNDGSAVGLSDFNWLTIRWGGVAIGTVNGDGTGGPLNATMLRFDSQPWDPQRGKDQDEFGVLLANGTFQRKINGDSNAAGVYFQEDGGFAARGGDLTVTLQNNAFPNIGDNPELQWGENNVQDGFRDNSLILGSRHATNMVTLTNPIFVDRDRDFIIQDNKFTDQDVAKLTGSISTSAGANRRVSVNRGERSDEWGGTLWVDAPLNLGGHVDSRIQVDDGVLRMGVAMLNNTSRLELSADYYDRPAIWESWGTVAITLAGNGIGTIKMDRNPNSAQGGGFAAYGAPFTLSFMRAGNSTPNYPLRWDQRDFGFYDNVLQLGSPTANDVVTITNNIDLWGSYYSGDNGYAADRGPITDGRMIRLFDNLYSENDRAVLSGKITDSFGPTKLYIRGAGRLALTNQNTFAGDVVVQSVEGPITLDLNHVLNLGNINNKLVLSDVNFNIGSSFGNATKQASLSGSLGVDIAKYSNLTLNGAANPGIGKTLTKKGPGGLTLNGLSISGNVDYQDGSLNLGSGVLALPGGQVNIGTGLNLKVSGMVAKQLVGTAPVVGTTSPYAVLTPGSTVTAVGNTVIGSLSPEGGYSFASQILTGNNSVSLLRDGALRLYGAVVGDSAGPGTLSSANGMILTPFGGGAPAVNKPNMIIGAGTVNGNLDLNGGRIRSVPANALKLTGIIGGSGAMPGVDLSQAVVWDSHTLTPSKSGTGQGGVIGVTSLGGIVFGFSGPIGSSDLDQDIGDYTQIVNWVENGALDLSASTANFSMKYTPQTSTVFRVLNAAPSEWEMSGYYKGFFSNIPDPLATPATFPAGQNWHWAFNWKNQAANEFWDAYITTLTGPPPAGPTIPSAYVVNSEPLRPALDALIGGSPLPHPKTLSYPNLDSTKPVDIAVFNPTYLDSELAPGGMRGLLYEVAGGMFDTFSIDPTGDVGQYQGPFSLMMWNNNGWTLGADNIVQNHAYDLSQYAGAQDKFVIMWDDPSQAFDLSQINKDNAKWFSTLTFGGGGTVNMSVTPVPEPGTLVLLICGGLALLVWRRRRAG